MAHSHATEPDGRDFQVIVSKFALLHSSCLLFLSSSSELSAYTSREACSLSGGNYRRAFAQDGRIISENDCLILQIFPMDDGETREEVPRKSFWARTATGTARHSICWPPSSCPPSAEFSKHRRSGPTSVCAWNSLPASLARSCLRPVTPRLQAMPTPVSSSDLRPTQRQRA